MVMVNERLNMSLFVCSCFLGFFLIASSAVQLSGMKKDYVLHDVGNVELQLPKYKRLKKSLMSLSLDDFLEKTRLIFKLESKRLSVTAIEKVVDNALDTYALLIGEKSMLVRIVYMRKNEILRLIFSKYPKILEKIPQDSFVIGKTLNEGDYNRMGIGQLLELPNAKTLTQRFNQHELDELINNTNIIHECAGKVVYLAWVPHMLDYEIKRLYEIKDLKVMGKLICSKSKIIELILRDHLEALEYVRNLK